MKYMGIKLDENKLMTQAYVIDYLKNVNCSDLQELRDIYTGTFGRDLVWNYQCCSIFFPGFYLMPAKEGFLSIPYNAVYIDEPEQIIVENVTLLTAEELQHRLEHYRAYATKIISAMEEMITITKEASDNA